MDSPEQTISSQPEPATDEDLLLVHQRGWITRLKNGTLDYLELMKLEIPYSRKMVDAFWLAAGGSILAARGALATASGSTSAADFITLSGSRRGILRDQRCRRGDPQAAAGGR